jgi:CBS domain-containing protein
MRQTLSVREVMRRTFVGVSEGDSVAGAAKLMHEEGVDGAVVVRGSDPVGILTASDVVAVVAAGKKPEATAVDTAMRKPAVTVSPDDVLEEAIGAIADHDVRWVAVVSEGTLVGTVTERDVVTAQSSLSPVGTPGPTETDAQGPERMRQDAGPENAVYATQGICEVCGSLSGTLDPHNGQLVCEDCRAM